MSLSIQVDHAPKAVGAYPHAKKVGNLLFLSGIGPRTPGSNAIPGNVYGDAGEVLQYDIAQQTHAVIANIKTVLEAAGAAFKDLVDITVYLTDMQRDFATYNQIWAQYFDANGPCRTTLGITALPTPIAIELKCIAMLPDSNE
jgi:2-aminomuconate deaminase